MFTGIIEEIGRVEAIDLDSPLDSLTISATKVMDDTRLGDSIAVNGACLTVTRINDGRFTVGVVPETVRRTNLGRLTVGEPVNLERPVQPASRMGGHFVQGHVDGTGVVASTISQGTELAVRIETRPDILRYVVEKGFIAVDGVSLTVTAVDESGFGVALVPYTREHVARGLLTAGSSVNLEVDILAKYAEKLVVH